MSRTAKNLTLVNEGGKVEYKDDIMARLTIYEKVVPHGLLDGFEKFKKSQIYNILFNTSQPGHIITALSVLTVCYLVLPGESKSSLASPFWTLIYLGSFGAHFGTQIWMSFISGISLCLCLPRHTFGGVQQVLFPVYFLVNSILSLITLAVFFKSHNHNLLTSPELAIQAICMSVCFLIELLIRVYLTPPLLHLMKTKGQIEKEAGVGMEVGMFVPKSLLSDPHYMKIHESFRKVHMTVSVGNIIAMSCTALHLYYLSQKFCAL